MQLGGLVGEFVRYAGHERAQALHRLVDASGLKQFPDFVHISGNPVAIFVHITVRQILEQSLAYL